MKTALRIIGSLTLLAILFWFIAYAAVEAFFNLYAVNHLGLSEADGARLLGELSLIFVLFALPAGYIGGRFGRKYVIWGSILGALPFTLMLPHANLFWTAVLIVPIGLILSSAFSAILVYAQELLPGRVGTIAGLFFGLAFGLGGIGAAVLGELADLTSIEYVYNLCAFLPALGLVTLLLPDIEGKRSRAPSAGE